MIKIKEDEKFTKVNNCVLALKDCKTGTFTGLRKIVLSNLIYKYNNFNKLGTLYTHKKGTYHFYFNQKELADEMGKDKKTVWRTMQWLQAEGYITYFPAPKPGYIWKASFVTMNEDFINSKIGNESKILTSDKVEKIDNNSIPTDIEINIEQLPIENIPAVTLEKVKHEKIFGKKEMESYLSNNKMVHFDSIRSKGYEPEIFEYENLVNYIWSVNCLQNNNNLDENVFMRTLGNVKEIVEKISQSDDEYDLYIDYILAKLDSSSHTEEHNQEKKIEKKEQLPVIENIGQIPNIIDIMPTQFFINVNEKKQTESNEPVTNIKPEKEIEQEKTISKKEQLPVIGEDKQMSDQNGTKDGHPNRIKFGKERFESYLLSDELVPFCVLSRRGYGVNKNKPEYKKLVGYIWQWCMAYKSPNNKQQVTHIYQTLSEICRDKKEEYNSYIDKINAKVKRCDYNLELEKL